MPNRNPDTPKITDIACIPTLDVYLALLASVHHQYLPAKGPEGFVHLQMARKVAQAVKRIVRHQHWRYELDEFTHIEAYLSDLLVLDEMTLMARYAGYACSSSLLSCRQICTPAPELPYVSVAADSGHAGQGRAKQRLKAASSENVSFCCYGRIACYIRVKQDHETDVVVRTLVRDFKKKQIQHLE